MPTAICTACSRNAYWRATRGTRLADIRCPHCGGNLRRANIGRGSRPGGKMIRCALPFCNRRRRLPSGNVRTLREPGTFLRFNLDATPNHRLEAGASVCWFHESEEEFARRRQAAEAAGYVAFRR